MANFISLISPQGRYQTNKTPYTGIARHLSEKKFMISIILTPLLLILFVVGVIFLLIGKFQNNRGLKKLFLGIGFTIWGIPLILFILGKFSLDQQDKEYSGTYSSLFQGGRVITLELFEDKTFEFDTKNCDTIIEGTWNRVLMDDYILELYLASRTFQANLSEKEISFYNPINIGCLENEKLILKKVANKK